LRTATYEERALAEFTAADNHMGHTQSQYRDPVVPIAPIVAIQIPLIEAKKPPRTWRDTRKDILTTFGYRVTAAPVGDEIPPDNIFTPIQADAILPQIPIGDHHPVPRKGIEDDHLRTLHTNKFYANAFLGEQNQPIWTHPYSIWWGKGSQEPGMLQTWGMNVSHVEESDLQYGPGEPPTVRCGLIEVI
jgi:endo-1,3(4)-beta-glucanase